MIIPLQDGWEEYRVRICHGCRELLHSLDTGDIAQAMIIAGGCGCQPPPAPAPALDEIRSWPAATSIAQASTAFGFSRSHGFELARRGEFPARVIKAGGRYIVVTADIIRALH